MVQSLNALEDQFHWCRHPFRAEDLHHLPVQFVDGQAIVQLSQDILSVLPATISEGGRARIIQCLQHRGLSPILPQRHSRLEGDDMIDGYNTIYIVFEVYELDMDSEQYKHVCENGELIISRGEDSFTKKHAFVNGQFVLIACGALCNDDEFHYGTDPQELEPPYTIGKVQEGYDAFIALK